VTADPTSAAPTSAAPTSSVTAVPASTTTVAPTPITSEPATPLPDGPDSFCDNVPVDAWMNVDDILYTGIAVDSMCLCMQNGEFTEESNTRLHSTLVSRVLAPRIDTMCQEYYAGQNLPYSGGNAETCPALMIDQIELRTLLNVSTFFPFKPTGFAIYLPLLSSGKGLPLAPILPAISLPYVGATVLSVRSSLDCLSSKVLTALLGRL
jgi:hypothetical protein